MKIGIIDADLLDNGTRHPNLALMKISGYYKSLGHEVKLLFDYSNINEYDKVFISKVFSFTNIPIDVKQYPNLTLGGTGLPEYDQELDFPIEHHMPDYTLYQAYILHRTSVGDKMSKFKDYQNYSIGFTTRGCFRKCEFCVNKKYDSVMKHSPVNEFLDKDRPYIYLWDDNFLAYKNWEEILDELKATKKPFQFRQGLDIRLMTEKKAILLSKVKYHGDFIFAFDYIRDRSLIERKLRLWREHVSKTTKLYVLTAYESQDIHDLENTFERIKILMKYGCLPYIMRYQDYRKSEYKNMYVQLARWCNQPRIFKKMSFRQFAEASQKYHVNKNTKCSTMQAVSYFEENHPEFANKYFDLRYEDIKEY